MNGLCATSVRDIENFLNVEIRLASRRWTDRVSFVGHAYMQSCTINIRKYGNCRDPELAARTNHAHCNLPPVRYEDLLEHAEILILSRQAEAP
jgi:hypothetical protein